MRKRGLIFSTLLLTATLPIFGQGTVFDNSGNGMLSGTYYFRHVLYGISSQADESGIIGDISEAIAVYGNISFNGSGTYTIIGGIVSDSYVDSQEEAIVQDGLSCYLAGTLCTAAQGTNVTGTYAISSNGFGYLTNPITGDKIYGLISANGVFAGSSSEATEAYNDLFIAAVATPSLTNSFFNGSYSAVGFFPGGGAAGFYDGYFGSPLVSLGASFQVSSNGSGAVSLNGNGSSGNGTAVSQAVNATYSFSNGAAVVTFPTSSSAVFFQGQAAGGPLPEYLYFSPDGNFFFGGSPTVGFDMIVGVRNSAGTLNFGGLYYQAGLDQNLSDLSGGYADFDGYFGSFNADGSGDLFLHERIADEEFGTYSWTAADSFTPPIPATYTDNDLDVQYAVGAGGAIRIGQGIWPYMGITIGLQAPSFSGSGTYLSPVGIVNAASFAPFTAGVSDGEMVTLFGNDLAPATMGAPANVFPLPTNINGVQVKVNGILAPLYYVSSTQILIQVPYESSLGCSSTTSLTCFAQFQVFNGASASNTVTEALNSTTPGVFTDDYGLGYGFVQHADYSLVTPSSPAQPNETVTAYVSGLGSVSPFVSDGAAAPSSPLSYASNTIAVDIGGVDATGVTAVLVPTLAGLYQINFAIPSTATSGDNTLDISGPDSYATQALISIGTGVSSAARQPGAKLHHRSHARTVAHRKPYCFPGPGKTCKPQ